MDFTVKGTAYYRNGFVTSVSNTDIVTATIQQQLMAKITGVYGIVNLRNVGIGWDVEFVDSDGSDSFYTTGIFVHELISLNVMVSETGTPGSSCS